ncbi:MAG: enoyl-CoA hydratase/isomerase family protein [Syntrophobacteraceae bacterium]
MGDSTQRSEVPVLVGRGKRMISIILNRPRVLNSLNTEMIRLIGGALDEAEQDKSIGFVVFRGTGERAFCAGGDINSLATAANSRKLRDAYEFFDEEYALDLRIYGFPKPVIVLADGITMGGGLGLSAGADAVVGTERTSMAMPESRIGLFPDVGATGWLFRKCPEGYPEFLALTGYELTGSECVRLGLATHICPSDRLTGALLTLEDYSKPLPRERKDAAKLIIRHLSSILSTDSSPNREMDEWVRTYFQGQNSILRIMEALCTCRAQKQLCADFFSQLQERSPTSLVLTLHLLRHNEGRAMEEVYAVDSRAARFMAAHHDFLEGVRARVVDKDDKPQWRPQRIEEVDLSFILPQIFAH